MKTLRPPFDHIADDLVATIRHWHERHKKDFDFYSVAAGVEAILQKYDLKLRPQPLERSEILRPERVCAVCGEKLGDHVITGARLLPGEDRLQMHPDCVAKKS